MEAISNNSINENRINTKYNINLDKRCTNLIAPPIVNYDRILRVQDKFANLPIRYEVQDLIKFCEKNKALVLKDLVLDFAATCNKIACAIFYGTQHEYLKGSYRKTKNKYNDWSDSIMELNGVILDATENKSALEFWYLLDSDINVSSDFLEKLDANLNKLFDNKNYLNNNVQLVKLFKYLGNRVLELAREACDNMYDKMEQAGNTSIPDKTAYLNENIFGSIIVPFYEKLELLKNNLYEMSKYINGKDYNKNVWDKKLQATADYINDVLNQSELKDCVNYFNKYNTLPEKQ